MNKLLKGVVPLAIVGAIGLVTYFRCGSSRVGAADEPAAAEAATHVTGEVSVISPRLGTVARTCVQPATVQSWDIVDLYTEVSGILSKQNVDINAEVTAGQLLAEIYAPDVVRERDLAKAKLEQAKKNVPLAEWRLKAAKAKLLATQAAVRRYDKKLLSARANFDFRKKRLDRYTGLVSEKAIEVMLMDEEEDRYQDAFSRKEDTKAALERAKENEKVQEAQIEEEAAALRVARLNMRVAEVALEHAQVFVDFAQIRAPFDGVVTQRSFNNGAFIRSKGQGGQVPLLTVKRTDKFRVVVYVPDTYVPYIQLGDPVDLTIFSLGMSFPGKVDRLALSEEQASRLMRAEIDMYNDKEKRGDRKGVGKGLLQDGMAGRIAIQVKSAAKVNPKVVIIPSVCLQGEGGEGTRRVLVVRKDADGKNRVHLQDVQVGFNDGKNAEIRLGLTPADRVVVESHGLVVDGAVVDVVPNEEVK